MTTITNQDYLRFKNDILKDIREFEKGINDQIKTKNDSFISSLLDLQDKLEKLTKETKTSTHNIIEITTKLNHFSDYFTFKQKIENMIFNHDIKLKMSMDEIDRIKSKYDKMIDDNIIIPGVTGKNSKYKNLKDYIYNNNNEMIKLKYALEEEKKITIEFKKKLENLPKSLISMVDSAVRRSNDFTEQKQKDIEKSIDIKFNDYNKIILETKVDLMESKKNSDERINSLKEEINKYSGIKTDIINIINENASKTKELEKEEDEKIQKIKEEIEEMKKNKNKFDNQVINNTQLINEIKSKLKSINNIPNNFTTIRNIKNDYNKSFNYNNNINYTKNNNNENNISNIQKKEEFNINITKINSRKNKPNIKLSFKEKPNTKILKGYYNSEVRKNKFIKDIENNKDSSPSHKKITTTNVKDKKVLNNLIQKKDINHFSLNNSDNDDSSSLTEKEIENDKDKEEDKNISTLNFKTQKETEKFSLESNRNNNVPMSYDEDKYSINKISNTEENKDDINKFKEINGFESEILKSTKNKRRSILKNKNLNDKKTINKMINFKTNNFNNNNINNISNEFKTNSLNNNLNDIKTIGNNSIYSQKKINKEHINNKTITENMNNNKIINDFNKNIINNNVYNLNNIKSNNTISNNTISNNNMTNNNSINNNIISNNNNIFNNNNIKNNISTVNKNNKKDFSLKHKVTNKNNTKIYTNEINSYNNFENCQNNNNLLLRSKMNLGVVDSFLNNSQYKNRNICKRAENLFSGSYTSRNDKKIFKDIQNSDLDIKINNIDLFSNTIKHINNINNTINNRNYSFNGKKLKHKNKNKKDESTQVDNLYKLYFKKHKNLYSSKEKTLNNLKRIAPAFGRTLYTFYDARHSHEIEISPYNNMF